MVEQEEVILVVLQDLKVVLQLFQRLVLLVVAEVVQEHQVVDQMEVTVDLVVVQTQVPLLDQEIHLLLVHLKEITEEALEVHKTVVVVVGELVPLVRLLVQMVEMVELE